MDDCRYERILEDRYEEVCTFITEHYCPDEPLSTHFGIVLNEDPVMKEMTMNDLRHNMSIALICCQTNIVIGDQLLTIAQNHKINPDEFGQSEKARQLMSFIAYKDTLVNVFDFYGVDELFSIFELAVHREHRQKGIGYKLMMAATVLASSLSGGPCVIKGNAVSNYSKRIFEKLGFDNIGEAKFEDYKVDGVNPMDNIGEHTSFKMYGKILSYTGLDKQKNSA